MKVKENSIKKYSTIAEAASYFDVPEHALRTWVKQGKVPSISIGAKRLINISALGLLLEDTSSTLYT